MARRSVAGVAAARQPSLPGLEELAGDTRHAECVAGPADPADPADPAGPDWEERCYGAGCAFARELAAGMLMALEAWLHLTRPAGYRVEGWRTRVLVTRMGDLRVRRRLYRDARDARDARDVADSAGRCHFLLDAHLGWLPRQVATPSVLALLVDWATDVPFADVATKLAAATAGVLSGPTVRRQLRRVAERVRATELVTHETWTTTGQVPGSAGERVVSPLYVEADGVHVKTQREPAHRGGYELKCASIYEGWERLAGPTPGHLRPHYALDAKQVYCHLHASDDVPFWEGASLAVHRTYDLSRLPLVVVGGDGANWIDTAADVFPRVVRQRDGFHLARDAARGWGTTAGAQLYESLRTGDQPTVLEFLALPAPPPPPPRLALPPPVDTSVDTPVDTTATGAEDQRPPAIPAIPATPATHAPRRSHWSPKQVARARSTVRSQSATPDAAADWRTQVALHEVPDGARALGTQEGTNAHLLARRMKRRGMSWTVMGAQAMAKARELVTNGTLAPWCLASQTTTAPAATPARPRGRLTGLPDPPLPWPRVARPTMHGPTSAATVAHLQRVLQGAYRLG